MTFERPMCCAAQIARTRRHTAATWLMRRGGPLWEAAGFLAPTLCMARLMPLHPSHGRFRWLEQWLTLKVLGKKGKKPNDYLVGVAGFEPATPASRTQCSTGLSHTPTKNAAYSLGLRLPQGADLGN
jgi:hypothetical protein